MRHPAAGEAPDDRLHGLDVVERYGRRRRELDQVAQLERGATVDELGEASVLLPAGTVDCAPERVSSCLQRLHDCWARRVRLAALAELHVARVLELRPETAERLALQL